MCFVWCPICINQFRISGFVCVSLYTYNICVNGHLCVGVCGVQVVAGIALECGRRPMLSSSSLDS